MTAESWMLEKSWNELVILDNRDILFLQGPLPGPKPGGVHHLLKIIVLSHDLSLYHQLSVSLYLY